MSESLILKQVKVTLLIKDSEVHIEALIRIWHGYLHGMKIMS